MQSGVFGFAWNTSTVGRTPDTWEDLLGVYTITDGLLRGVED